MQVYAVFGYVFGDGVEEKTSTIRVFTEETQAREYGDWLVSDMQYDDYTLDSHELIQANDCLNHPWLREGRISKPSYKPVSCSGY